MRIIITPGILTIMTGIAFGLCFIRFFEYLAKPWSYLMLLFVPFMVFETVEVGLTLLRGILILNKIAGGFGGEGPKK